MNYQCPVKKCSEFGAPPPPPPPPEHFAIGYVHNDNLAFRQYCITICHSKQLQEGRMVFSDDFLHFLKIKKKMVEFTKTILWL